MAQKERLGDWFRACEDRTENGYLPSLWLEELEAIVEEMLIEAAQQSSDPKEPK